MSNPIKNMIKMSLKRDLGKNLRLKLISKTITRFFIMHFLPIRKFKNEEEYQHFLKIKAKFTKNSKKYKKFFLNIPLLLFLISLQFFIF